MNKKTDRNDGLAASLMRNISVNSSVNDIEEKEVKTKEPKKNKKITNRYFKMDSEISEYYDFLCDIYGWNKSSDGIEEIINYYRYNMRDEVTKKAEEKQKRQMELLTK